MERKVFMILALYAVLGVVCFSVFLFYSKGHPSKIITKDQDPGDMRSRFSWGIKGQESEPSEVSLNSSAEALEPCPDDPPNLVGPLLVEFETSRTLEQVREQIGPLLQPGGRYQPPDCVSKQKVAIIIPFRNRYEHLNHWLYYLHPILIRQQLSYGVYVINQDGDGVYNKAKLMNAGHIEALKDDDYDCFLFSDVDLVPLDDRNLYRCSDRPRHLAVAIDKFDYELPYEHIFGGVTALSKEQFLTVNGFSNTYWGWGGEDDDIYNRIMFRIKAISRPDAAVARYKMIKHERDVHNEQNLKNVDKLQESKKTLDLDGLSTVSYTVRQITKDVLFTFITIDVHVPLNVPNGARKL